MRPVHRPLRRSRARLRALLAPVLGLALTVGIVVPAQAAGAPTIVATLSKPAAPTNVRTATNYYGKFDVTWTKVSNATLYKVHVFSDAAATQRVYKTGYTTKDHKWVDAPEIKEGKTYYYRVRSYNTKSVPGAYSEIIKVKTGVQQVKTPTIKDADPTSPTSLKVTWAGADLATTYQVKISATKDGPTVQSSPVLHSWDRTYTFTGLNPDKIGQTFFVKVTAARKNTTFRDSKTIAAALPYPEESGATTSVRVGSYNVLNYTYDDAVGRSWSQRVDELGDMIDDLDLVGVQEATWGKVGSERAVEMLADQAGLKVALVPGTSTGCSINSSHVLYRSTKFWTVDCGSVVIREADNRTATWVRLRSRDTGKDVFAVSTHLTSGSDSTATSIRNAEAKNVLAMIDRYNTANLPVVLMGDMNSFHGRADTTPVSLFSDAGLVGSDLVADTRSKINYSTVHYFTGTPMNRLRIDHILISEGVDPVKFTVRWHTPSTAPTDHHVAVAILELH